MKEYKETFFKIRDAINFIRENGTNTCSSTTWKAHCDEWDDVNVSTYAIEQELEELNKQLAEKNAEIERLMAVSPTDKKFIAIGEQVIELHQQLAASQAREVQLREALIVCVCAMQDYQAGIGITEMFDKGERMGRLALQSEKQDTTAISAMIAKAGEVMRERCESTLEKIGAYDNCYGGAHAIRALPGVTLEDLK